MTSEKIFGMLDVGAGDRQSVKGLQGCNYSKPATPKRPVTSGDQMTGSHLTQGATVSPHNPGLVQVFLLMNPHSSSEERACVGGNQDPAKCRLISLTSQQAADTNVTV